MCCVVLRSLCVCFGLCVKTMRAVVNVTFASQKPTKGSLQCKCCLQVETRSETPPVVRLVMCSSVLYSVDE